MLVSQILYTYKYIVFYVGIHHESRRMMFAERKGIKGRWEEVSREEGALRIWKKCTDTCIESVKIKLIIFNAN